MKTNNTAKRITPETTHRTRPGRRVPLTVLPDDLDPIIRSAASGDREAIAGMARHLRPLLLQQARTILRPLEAESEAEDVVQDVFVFLLSGQARGTPPQGRAVRWVCHLVQYLAEQRGYLGAEDLDDLPVDEIPAEDPPEEEEVE